MADYITKIRTQDGDKQIDYNSLANLPSDFKLLYETITTEEVKSIYTGINPSEYNEIVMYCISKSSDSTKSAHFDWYCHTNTGGMRHMSALHESQTRCFYFHAIKVTNNFWEVNIMFGSCGVALGTEVGDKVNAELTSDKKIYLLLNDSLNTEIGCGAYNFSESNLAVGTIFKVYGK